MTSPAPRRGEAATGDVLADKWAVAICNHSGRHAAGDGDHDADRWGPCSQCLHYARVVLALPEVAELRAATLREAAAEIRLGLDTSNAIGQGVEYACTMLDRASLASSSATEPESAS